MGSPLDCNIDQCYSMLRFLHCLLGSAVAVTAVTLLATLLHRSSEYGNRVQPHHSFLCHNNFKASNQPWGATLLLDFISTVPVCRPPRGLNSFINRFQNRFQSYPGGFGKVELRMLRSLLALAGLQLSSAQLSSALDHSRTRGLSTWLRWIRAT